MPEEPPIARSMSTAGMRILSQPVPPSRIVPPEMSRPTINEALRLTPALADRATRVRRGRRRRPDTSGVPGTPYTIVDSSSRDRYALVMARLARVIAPGLPHHITQRGNRRQQTFFSDEDYQSYIELMAQWCGARQVEIWAYCLVPNHACLGCDKALPCNDGASRVTLPVLSRSRRRCEHLRSS